MNIISTDLANLTNYLRKSIGNLTFACMLFLQAGEWMWLELSPRDFFINPGDLNYPSDEKGNRQTGISSACCFCSLTSGSAPNLILEIPSSN
ncbi:hypothetical protein [Rhodohalobacter sp. 8-1]|uniref:hypothetical protein n=1 Tax=Rhodohalobacter sp. 8-1 TaxID=3131972 RepID=UPI0030EEAB2D